MEVGAAKKITEEAKTALEEKKDKETDLRYQKELEKKFLSAKEVEKAQGSVENDANYQYIYGVLQNQKVFEFLESQ